MSRHGNYHTVPVFGREDGYLVKHTPLPEGVPDTKPKGTPEGKGVTVYPESSPNTDSISF